MTKVLLWESLGIMAGGQKVAIEVATALSGRYECIFLIPEKGSFSDAIKKKKFRYDILDIGNYSVGSKNLRDVFTFAANSPRVFIEAYNLIKNEKIDLLYANSARNFVWAAFLGTILRIPVIWHIHNYFSDSKTKFVINKVGKLKSVRRVIFVANTVSKQFPGLAGKSVIVPNGIDSALFTVNGKAKCQIRKELNIPDNRRLIITIGWLMPSKRQELLLKAMPSILECEKNIHCLFVGGKRAGYEEYFDYLLNTVHSMKLEDYATFAGHRNNIADILETSYLNVITSEEAFPFTLLEGWAAGVPTIGPDFGSLPELVENGKTGLLYDHTSPKDLADKILFLLAEPERYEKIKKSSLDNKKKYDVKTFHKKIVSVVEEVFQA
jgi:glycosyltransferase involved in cell wall biosynthesis